MSVIALARDGVAPAALCALLARQGQTELAAMLSSTQMLEPLPPIDRAHLLRSLLKTHPQSESTYVGP